MKRRLLGLLLLCVSVHAFGQTRAGPKNIAANSTCLSVGVNSGVSSSVLITVSGTWSATLQPEIISHSQPASNVQATPTTSTTAQSTITANGSYWAVTAGADTFQVCTTAYVSGTAVVTLTVSSGVASNSLGGGGGGSGVSSLSVTVPTGLNVTPGTLNSPGTFAFTWSGTIPAAQIPAPTATTLGGVESITSASHNWIAYIDTSGVPHQGQPACADLSTAGTGCSATIANYLALAGGTMSGELVTHLSAIGTAGFNLPHGAAPTAPVNGDLWTTTAGLYAQINGGTVGPLGTGGSSGISGLTANYIPLAGSSTTITANSHLDDGVTTAATITSSESIALSSDGTHAGAIQLAGNTTVPALNANSFGWLGPNSAIRN